MKNDFTILRTSQPRCSEIISCKIIDKNTQMHILIHMPGENYKTIIENLFKKKSIIKLKEITDQRIHPEYIRRMILKGQIIRVGHGIYMKPDTEITANHSLVEISKQISIGVICLLSALQYHEIGTQMPSEIWLGIPRKNAIPRTRYHSLRIITYSEKTFYEGIDEHTIEGVLVKIYNPAKTIADCFKYRNKIGLDTALEALKEVLKNKICTIDDLWKYAKICRVHNIMKPYLEVLI